MGTSELQCGTPGAWDPCDGIPAQHRAGNAARKQLALDALLGWYALVANCQYVGLECKLAEWRLVGLERQRRGLGLGRVVVRPLGRTAPSNGDANNPVLSRRASRPRCCFSKGWCSRDACAGCHAGCAFADS